jgi:hypothetical protein
MFKLGVYREFRKDNSHLGKVRFLTLLNRHFQSVSIDLIKRKELADMFPTNSNILSAIRKGVYR